MKIVPITLRAANELVQQLHRHSKPTQGHKFSIGVEHNGTLVGAAIVGRPVSRAFDDGKTAEVLRVVTDGTPNACSMLYGASRRAARAMGYTRVLTYTLSTEPGTSLKAAGFTAAANVKPQTWNRPSRPREETAALSRVRWEA